MMLRPTLLLPRDGVTLGGYWCGDDAATTQRPTVKRFRQLFAEVWRSIPCYDRRIIRTHIHGGHVTLTDCDYDSALWGHAATARHGDACYYDDYASPPARRMYFWTTLWMALPDEHAKTLIAHELGHAFCCALPDEYPGQHQPYDAWDAELAALRVYLPHPAEVEASEVLSERWDYDNNELNAYMREHRASLPKPTAP